ncbi:hypothetical protein KPL74_00370 [Bacillus sp. NP157]|nr:hypothetical protein KPL74_00370 [Bacillus sp. NP157]
MMTINLHDALFHSYELECGTSSTATFRVSYYPDEQSSTRIDATIRIANASSIATNIDLERLAIHKVFGDVSDWSPSQGRGLTYIHLAGGTISVFGDEPVLSVATPVVEE